MFEIKYYQHDQLTDDLLDLIIEIKNISWPFGYESQKKWMKDNLKDSDIHVLLLKDKKAIAYLNLIEIEFTVDSIKTLGFGIGNVCAISKGMGWGKELIIRVNSYLQTMNRVGLLFCKNSLLKFYKENAWISVPNDKFKNKNSFLEVNILTYNLNVPYSLVEFNGELF